MPAEYPPNPAGHHARGQNKMWRGKSGKPSKSGLSGPLRHIFYLATYPVKCGAPHFMSESFTYGSVGGVGRKPGPYPASYREATAPGLICPSNPDVYQFAIC
jgi:hypothetical protein